MNRRERIENTIAGYATDRPPAALWRHFPGDDQRTADFAQSIVDFQRRYDWDFASVTPASTYGVADYGAQSVWDGSTDGDRRVETPFISRSLTWTELRTLDPGRGELGKHLECLRLVREGLGEDVPIVMTIYSPLMQAARLAGTELLKRHMRTRPDRLRSGLNIITENTLRFLEALRRTAVDGVHYVVEHADFDELAEAEYAVFGLPYDRKILSEVPSGWWLNVLQLRGAAPMFNLVKDYPVQAVNWQSRAGNPDLPQGKSIILGAVCGGLPGRGSLLHHTPAELRTEARDALQLVNERRMILSAEGVVPVTTPLSNLRAVRAALETVKGSA